MSFLTGIFFLMIFAVLFFLAFVISIFLRIKRKVTGIFTGNSRGSDPRGTDPRGTDPRGSDPRDGGPQPRPARQGKKIDPTVGEYVEFEEVQVYESTEPDGKKQVKFETEEQITDVEWEEVR